MDLGRGSRPAAGVAGSVDDVRVATNKAATTLIHHNAGEAIGAFEIFRGRYAKGKDDGWLGSPPSAGGGAKFQ